MTTILLLLSLPTYPGDETWDARRDKLTELAHDIDAVTARPEERAMLVADAWFESRLARYVIEGRCLDGPRGARCDPDKHGIPRARGVWQTWRWCKATDQQGEARCVLSVMRLGKSRCASYEGAFATLHSGACHTKDSLAREQMLRRMLSR